MKQFRYQPIDGDSDVLAVYDDIPDSQEGLRIGVIVRDTDGLWYPRPGGAYVPGSKSRKGAVMQLRRA